MKHFVLTILQFYYSFNLNCLLLSVYFQDPSSKGFAYVKKSYLVREATFVFMMGMFDLFVCF